MPRSTAVILVLVAFLSLISLAHGLLPWAISTSMPRYGWAEGSPGIWNRLGLIPIAAAAMLLIWILVSAVAQLAETPGRVKLGINPSFLIVRGPYRFTRNPMYVAELGLWLGWTLFFGSLGVLIGWMVLWLALSLIVLPREERGLEAALGQIYLRYKNRVPRWLGKIKE